MSQALHESLCDSIRHELRLFAKDTFEVELLQLGDRVEKGLREELREFLEVWGASEGKACGASEGMAFKNAIESDFDVCGTLNEADNGQSGWLTKHRGGFGVKSFMKQATKGSNQKAPETQVVPSSNDKKGEDQASQAMQQIMAPPTLSKGKKNSMTDSLMYRHPKGFRIGQEAAGDGQYRSEGEGGKWAVPFPDGAAQTMSVPRAISNTEIVPVNGKPETTRQELHKEEQLTVDEFDSFSPVSPFRPPDQSESTADGSTAPAMKASRSMRSNRENGTDATISGGAADCQGQPVAIESSVDDHVYGITGRGFRTTTSIFSDGSVVFELAQGKQRVPSIADIVRSPNFDYLTGSLIVLNSMVIGIQTDYMARQTTDDVPVPFAVIERIFCAAFTIELVMRMYTYGRRFIYGSGWRWNLFDTVIVLLQLTEEIMAVIAIITHGANHSQQIENLSIMRTLRILRLIRIIRLVRVLRLISELRTIVVSIVGSMKSLGWTILLLLLMMYIIGVFLTQLVSSYKVEAIRDGLWEDPAWEEQRREEDSHRNLGIFYGDLGSSILTLFQSISGGLDWDDSVSPLMEYVSPWLALLFSLYIAFAVFALFNIVTGVFVESALATAKGDQDLLLMHNVRQLFMSADVDKNGNITWEEFQSSLEKEQMIMYFQAIDLDKEEARELFKLIDIDDSGSIDPEEFLNGCFRLRGSAKAMDLAVLMHETKRMNRKWYLHAKFMETSMSFLLQQAGVPVQQQRLSITSDSSVVPLSSYRSLGDE